MAKTKAEIAEKGLQKLGVLESGETVDSADQTIVEDVYDSTYKILAAQDLVSWGSGDDIPTEAVNPIVFIVAENCLTEFIIPQDKQMLVIRGAEKAMGQLKMLEFVDYVPDEEGHYYF